MAELVRSDAKQGMVEDGMPMERRTAPRQDERMAEPPLWLTLLARWGSAEAVRGMRPRADLTVAWDDEAVAPG